MLQGDGSLGGRVYIPTDALQSTEVNPGIPRRCGTLENAYSRLGSTCKSPLSSDPKEELFQLRPPRSNKPLKRSKRKLVVG